MYSFNYRTKIKQSGEIENKIRYHHFIFYHITFFYLKKIFEKTK